MTKTKIEFSQKKIKTLISFFFDLWCWAHTNQSKKQLYINKKRNKTQKQKKLEKTNKNKKYTKTVKMCLTFV